jgi:hypothetical protein
MLQALMDRQSNTDEIYIDENQTPSMQTCRCRQTATPHLSCTAQTVLCEVRSACLPAW